MLPSGADLGGHGVHSGEEKRESTITQVQFPVLTEQVHSIPYKCVLPSSKSEPYVLYVYPGNTETLLAGLLTLYVFKSTLLMHWPLMQLLPSPQGVPSAQGKYFVWHMYCPLICPVHHSEEQGGRMLGQWRESGPKLSWHCWSTS